MTIDRVRQAGREVLLLAALWLVYDLGRLLGQRRAGGAYETGAGIWDFERAIGLPDERSVQDLVLGLHPLVESANLYYKYVHFPLTVAVLCWLFVRAPQHYRWFRTSIVAASGIALAAYIVLPVAPPRLMSLGMLDTGRAFGQSVYGLPGARSMTNQFASMPSLHVGWALLVAAVMIHVSRHRYRWLWAAHPVITLLVVIVTANHYWLDAAAGAALVTVAMLAFQPEALKQETTQARSMPSGLTAIRNRTVCPGRN